MRADSAITDDSVAGSLLHQRTSLRPAPSADDCARLRANGDHRLKDWGAIRWATIRRSFTRAGVSLPPRPDAIVDAFQLNKPLQAAMAEYIRRTHPSIKAFVELIRGQTPDDYRPNKAILPASLTNHCRGYAHLSDLLSIASVGVRAQMQSSSARPRRFPRNHPSAAARIAVLRKNVRKEQDLLRCLVVDADIIDIWPELFISPFGVVDKGTGDPRLTGLTIRDLSFPDEDSVNHRTDCSFVPRPTFEHASSIAREILRCKRVDPDAEIKVMSGDVSAAYRNACTHSECVHHFAGHIPEDNAIVIDLSAAFGWSGSAGAYGVLGGAVAFVHGCSSDSAHPHGYYNYHWVDDHVNVAADIGTRCADIERSLRFAMTAVLGPAAINEPKFTAWSTRQQVLGLVFDTAAGSVAMPPAKIAKGARLVASALRAATMSRSEFRSLMGSLRHVATCARPAHRAAPPLVRVLFTSHIPGPYHSRYAR